MAGYPWEDARQTNGLSYRDVEELLAERGVTVDHVTVHRWVQRLTSEFTRVGAAVPPRAW